MPILACVGIPYLTPMQTGMSSTRRAAELRVAPPAPSTGNSRARVWPSALARAKPDALLYVVAILDWGLVWRFQDLIPGLARFKLVFVFLAIGLVTGFTASHRARDFPSTKSPIMRALLVVFGLAVVGVPFSLYRGGSTMYIVYEIIPHLEFTVLAAYAIRNVEDLDWLAFWHLVGAASYSAIIYVKFPVGADGRLGALTYYDTNDFALMLVCTLPVAVYFMRPGVSLVRRLIALASLAIIFRMLILTGSRGGFIGLITVMGFLAFAFTSIPKRLRVAAVVTAVVIFTALGSQRYWGMIDTVRHPTSDYNWVGNDPIGRMEVWKRGLGYMAGRPLLGVGMGSFPVAEGTISDVSKQFAAEGRGLKWSVAHNTFIEVGAELGIPALLFFIALIVASFQALRSVRVTARQNPQGARALIPMSDTLAGSLIGYIVCGFFVSAEHFALLYLLLGMTMALHRLATREGQREAPKSPQRRSARPVRPRPVQWTPAG